MNRFIPDEIIDTIRTRADIIDVVQSYVPQLKRSGQNWKACCPFHKEKTPSFMVNPSSQSFHCFGCGKGGDAFRFVMDIENLDFPNAAYLLARKYNVIIPESETRRYDGKTDSERSTVNHNRRERVFILHEKLAQWYAQNLKDNPTSQVAEYFATRKIPQEFTSKFMIGASPDSWDATMNWALRSGFTIDEIKDAGIVVEKDESQGRFYDRFRNRLMFPIWNEQGRIVAFSARTVEKEPQGGKYVNSPETPIFKKSRTLYGLHFARQEISKKGYTVLCEGQLDTIAMHRAGCSNAVAPQGTAFTQEQAQILRRYSENLYLALDADSAGTEAIFKVAAIAIPMSFNLKVVVFPGGKDPDELLKTAGAEAVSKSVEDARDFFEFTLDKAMRKFDVASPTGKAKAAENVLSYIALIDNRVLQDSYCEWLAEKLGSNLSAITAELGRATSKLRSVNQSQNRHQDEPAAPRIIEFKEVPESVKNPLLKKALSGLLEVIIRNGVCAEAAKNEITHDMLDTGPLASAVETVIQAKINGEWEHSAAMITQNILSDPDKPCPELSAILAKEPSAQSQTILLKTASDCIKVIKTMHLRRQIESIRIQFAGMEPGPERDDLVRQMSELTRSISKLSSTLKA